MHYIFLIPGMGSYLTVDKEKKRVPSTDWFDRAKESIVQAYDSHDFLKALPFDTHFECVPVNYDEYMDSTLAETEKVLSSLTKLYPNSKFLGAAARFFTGSSDLNSNFFWTHAFDVFLYRYSSLIRQGIINRASGIITDKATDGKSTSYSVIAHSLGTALASDVMTLLHGDIQRREGLHDNLRPAKIVAMIANVSKAMEHSERPVYADALAPGKSLSLQSYLTAAHVLDPFTMVAPFEPKGIDAWDSALSPFGFERYTQATGLRHYNTKLLSGADGKLNLSEVVPHQFAHYFANPRVHLPIFREIATDAKWPSDIDAYIEQRAKAFGTNNSSVQFNNFADKLEGIEKLVFGDKVPHPDRILEFLRKAIMQIGA